MRFHISMMNPDTLDQYLVEVIGDVVDIPGMPANSCAVHALVNMREDQPLYAVSHIESGWRVGGGDSIEYAIERAKAIVSKVDPGARDKRLAEALEVRRAIELASTT